MGEIIDYFAIGQQITNAIIKGVIWAAKGGIWAGKAVYSHNKIRQDDEEYHNYERYMKDPYPPELLHSAAKNGIFFGSKYGRYIRKPENQDGHVLVIGGTGSGKTSCIAIPTLCAWKGRVFAIDIKGELYAKSRDFRGNIKVMSPTEAKEPFWTESAQNLLTAALLYQYKASPFLSAIDWVLTTPKDKLVETLYRSENIAVRSYISAFVGMSAETFSGIYAELQRHIIIFSADTSLRAFLSKKVTATPADLEQGFDIYLNIPEHLLSQWKNFLTLIVNQFLNFFERRSDTNTTPILFLLDEFPRLGRIPAIQNGLATLRSRKVTICLILQNIAQLNAIYGHEHTNVILGNCDYKAVLDASDYDTQKYLSALCGTYLKRMANSGYQTPLPTGVNEGASQQYAPIIQEHEFGTMRDIVLISPLGKNTAFCRVEKRPWYAEK